ncbi:MAG: peptidase T [Mycoplasmatales bacterium]
MNSERLKERFLKYVSINTKSDPENPSPRPSTKEQFDLLDILNDELNTLGLDVNYDKDNGYIYAKLKANKDGIDPIGFIAHVDTAPDISGENVKPLFFENYDGGVLKLNEEYSLDPNEFPELKKYIGNTIITTSGDTLLGSDDKSGVAEIMEAVTYFVENPNEEHGDICVGFTTDEEIGTGANEFDVEAFGAKYAYTLDGGEVGELSYENFNAATVIVDIEGLNVHPGAAKNKLVNAQELAMDLHNTLPDNDRPEHTEGSEGFYHLVSSEGTVEKAKYMYIVRDHDKTLFENKIKFIEDNFNQIVIPKAPKSTIDVSYSYYNMLEKVEPCMEIVDIAKQAMENIDIECKIEPIRGGTDGSKLSFKGLPCPNIFAGGHNFHGRFEYVPFESMEKATLTTIEIIKIFATK